MSKKVKVTVESDGITHEFEFDGDLLQYESQNFKNLEKKINEFAGVDWNRVALCNCGKYPEWRQDEKNGVFICCQKCKKRTAFYGKNTPIKMIDRNFGIPNNLHTTVRLAWNKGERLSLEKKYCNIKNLDEIENEKRVNLIQDKYKEMFPDI